MRGAIERNRRLKFDEEHDAKRVRLTQRVRSTNATREKQRDAHREHARCICCRPAARDRSKTSHSFGRWIAPGRENALRNFQNLSSNKKRWRPARLSSKGEELRHAHSTELPILLRGEPALATLPRWGWSIPAPLKVGSHSFVWRESSNGYAAAHELRS